MTETVHDTVTVTVTASVEQTTSAPMSTFATDADWNKYVHDLVPASRNFVTANAVDVAKQVCSDFGQEPRLTDDVIDQEVKDLLAITISVPWDREEAWTFLKASVAEYCPDYTSDLAGYPLG